MCSGSAHIEASSPSLLLSLSHALFPVFAFISFISVRPSHHHLRFILLLSLTNRPVEHWNIQRQRIGTGSCPVREMRDMSATRQCFFFFFIIHFFSSVSYFSVFWLITWKFWRWLHGNSGNERTIRKQKEERCGEAREICHGHGVCIVRIVCVMFGSQFLFFIILPANRHRGNQVSFQQHIGYRITLRKQTQTCNHVPCARQRATRHRPCARLWYTNFVSTTYTGYGLRLSSCEPTMLFNTLQSIVFINTYGYGHGQLYRIEHYIV